MTSKHDSEKLYRVGRVLVLGWHEARSIARRSGITEIDLIIIVDGKMIPIKQAIDRPEDEAV